MDAFTGAWIVVSIVGPFPGISVGYVDIGGGGGTDSLRYKVGIVSCSGIAAAFARRVIPDKNIPPIMGLGLHVAETSVWELVRVRGGGGAGWKLLSGILDRTNDPDPDPVGLVDSADTDPDPA